MRFGPPFRHAHRQDGRRVADQVVGDGNRDLVFLEWQLYAVELAER